jgi:3-hydroxyacyl-CoA dehydrogenase
MNGVVQYDTRDGVAILSIRNPPVNALGQAVRRALWEGIERAEANPEVGAVLIRAEGRTFPAGADLREFDAPARSPALTELCNRVEACSKPVVAAIHGTALGGGFELALACHFRVADRNAKLGLPEIALGVLPGAGGTQRVPRITGAGPALDIMLSGMPISAAAAARLGLVDKLVEANLGQAGFAMARDMAREGAKPHPTGARREGFADAAAYLDAVAERRTEISGATVPAPSRIVDCVEAALLLPFEAGLAMERAAFEDLAATEQARALRHVFFAERRAAKFPEFAGGDVAPHPVELIGIVGAGHMGMGIAIACLDAGLAVVLVERNEETMRHGLAGIEAVYDRAIGRGRMRAEGKADRLERLVVSAAPEDLAEADMVIETVGEDDALKRGLYERLDGVMKAGAVLASSTTYLDIDRLATATTRAGDVLGLHFFPPAHSNKAVEVVPGKATAAVATATAEAFARRLGKIAVRAGNRPGFIGYRVLAAYYRAVDLLLEAGADPGQVDSAMRGYGFAAGPCHAQDIAGLEPMRILRRRLGRAESAIIERLCESGRLGQRNSRGFFRYEAGSREPETDPEALHLIEAVRTARGNPRQNFTDEQIRDRCLDAMANEGARLLEEDTARCPSDIDVVMIHAFGFPRWRGGPMMQADLTGLLAVENRLRGYAGHGPDFWQPAPLFDGLVKNGLSFASMNLV